MPVEGLALRSRRPLASNARQLTMLLLRVVRYDFRGWCSLVAFIASALLVGYADLYRVLWSASAIQSTGPVLRSRNLTDLFLVSLANLITSLRAEYRVRTVHRN